MNCRRHGASVFSVRLSTVENRFPDVRKTTSSKGREEMNSSSQRAEWTPHGVCSSNGNRTCRAMASDLPWRLVDVTKASVHCDRLNEEE